MILLIQIYIHIQSIILEMKNTFTVCVNKYITIFKIFINDHKSSSNIFIFIYKIIKTNIQMCTEAM